MNSGELELYFRQSSQDLVEPYFFTTEEFYRAINEADVEACRRAKSCVSTDISTGETKSLATITVYGDSGSINGVYVNNINIITNPVQFTGNQILTASILSNEINNTGLFTATVNGADISIQPLDGVGADLNNIVPIVIGTLDCDVTAFVGGVDGICKIRLLPGKSTYEISSKIIKRNKYYHGETMVEIPVVDYRELDDCNPGWQLQKGEPVSVVHGMDSKKVSLYKTPTKKGLLVINATHLPVKKMVLPTDEPTTEEQHHMSLVDWVLFRYYSKNDSETQNKSDANYFLNRFKERFGQDEDAQYEVSRKIFADDYGDY